MDSEEKAFWDHLEAHPEDSTCRLVFADWLQERGDPRAEGIRVLGRLGKWAGKWDYEKVGNFRSGWWLWHLTEYHTPHNCLENRDWWNIYYWFMYKMVPEGPTSIADAEGCAALAWLDLTQEQRDGICKLD